MTATRCASRKAPSHGTSGYLVEPGDRFEVTLTVPGVYDYFCTPHEAAGMVGRIIVGQPARPRDDAVRLFPGRSGDAALARRAEGGTSRLPAHRGDHERARRAGDGLTTISVSAAARLALMACRTPRWRSLPANLAPAIRSVRTSPSSGGLAVPLCGTMHRRRRLDDLEATAAQPAPALEAGAEELAVCLEDMLPSDGPPERAGDLQIVPGLLAEQVHPQPPERDGTFGRRAGRRSRGSPPP